MKTMARRLGLDVRTLRSRVSRIEAGATTPCQAPHPSKLDRHRELIGDIVARECLAVQIHAHFLATDPELAIPYESVERLVGELRPNARASYQRLRFATESREPRIHKGAECLVLS